MCQFLDALGLGKHFMMSLFVYTVPVQAVRVRVRDSLCLQDNVDATVFCEVEGYPYPGIEFNKDNELLETEDGRIALNDCDMVLLTPVVMADQGLYSCTARNVVNGVEVESTSTPVMLQYCSE